MKAPSNKPDETPTPPSVATVFVLLRTIGDTTWRMFIPTIGATIVGVIIDRHTHHAPWATIVGICVGIVITALLLRNQLKKVNHE